MKVFNLFINFTFLDHDSFSINWESGSIRTTKLLDRETIETYTLKVLAVDQGVPKLNATATVIITLNDVQDSPPAFTKRVYNFTIEENSLVEVGTVKATLPDKDFRHSLIYRVVSMRYYGVFLMDRSKGTIRPAKSLDYEKQSFYEIKVRVQTEEGLEDTAVVNVHVKDVNDNKPVLKNFYIYLNALDGSYDPIFKVPAADPDVSSTLTYALINTERYSDKYITLGERGQIFIRKNSINTQVNLKYQFEVSDGRWIVKAYGHFMVREFTPFP